MKYIYALLFTMTLVFCFAQNKITKEDFESWKKAVVNIETEGLLFPKYYIDSVIKSKTDSGYTKIKLDSISNILRSTTIGTGTAIYITYRERRYLITAKHVLNDDSYLAQKKYENLKGINSWNPLEAIRPRISIRTPFEYYMRTRLINNYAVFNLDNFIKGEKPFFFISDSTGDGLGVISLQQKSYKILDSVLQVDGYVPIEIEKVCTNQNINELDEIYTVGFPEGVSVFGRVNFNNGVILNQTADIVVPFIVKGHVAMFRSNIQHFYVDLTITPGNSGGPIIENGKLIGIVSGINKYKIINEGYVDQGNSNLYGIGHLVNIINTKSLLENLDKYQSEEDKLIQSGK